jgi:hypothetical protein
LSVIVSSMDFERGALVFWMVTFADVIVVVGAVTNFVSVEV